ncbi:MAG TPA: DUF971 domain-containing protein [Patescibacteria group bacterium]|jgi:DUF971 family protein|nr:DUF971 domain-containing protein [Patescibacteria group bacterium]
MNATSPAGLTADRNLRIVTIEWTDGHSSTYSFDGLRAVCPCVECRGGHANMGLLPDPQVVRAAPDSSLDLEQVETVGAYAVQFVWSDGHSAGIFSWELLRAACPCEECIASASQA